MITKKQLLDHGFVETDDDPFHYEKKLINAMFPHDGYNQPAIVVTSIRNSMEFAFSVGEGHLVFLNVKDLDELAIFESCVSAVDSPYVM